MFPSAHHKRRSAIFCGMFFLLLCIGLSGLVHPSETTQENRALAPRPALANDATLLDYPRHFNDYAADHFGGRSWLVLGLNIFKLRVLGISGNPDVLVGREGWLFLNDDLLEQDLAGQAQFTEEELKQWQRYLEHRRDMLRRKNIDYLFMIVPDKHTIYPEHLPSSLQPEGQTRREQLVRYVSEHSDVRIIDATASVLSAGKQQPLYFKHDTHWSDIAAYAAYGELMRNLEKTVAAGAPLPPTAFDVHFGPAPLAVLSRFLGMERVLPDEYEYATLHVSKPAATLTTVDPGQREILVSNNPQAPRIRLLAYRDSFFDSLVPWLGEHFSFAAFIRSAKERPLSEADLLRYRPNVVIEEIVERKLRILPVP